MASSTIYNKLKTKIEDTDNFIQKMNDKITSGEYLEESVDSALQSYLYDWYEENSSEIYADDVIQIKATDDAYSTAILVENSDGTYTAYINDDSNEITKYQGIEHVQYDESGNEFIMTAQGEEIYNFRPPTATTLGASDVVGYIIGKDGRITYYMADGSCEISHKFEYDDGRIEYIECLICGDMALIQIRPITYRWIEDSELIYYDNYIETPDIIYGWDDTYTEIPELKPPFRIMWYTWKEDSEIIYFEVKIDDVIINYDWLEYERPEIDHDSGLSYKIEKDYDHENRYMLFEFPVFWRRPEFCDYDPEYTRRTSAFKIGSCADCVIDPIIPEPPNGGWTSGSGSETDRCIDCILDEEDETPFIEAGLPPEYCDGEGVIVKVETGEIEEKEREPEFEIPEIPPDPEPIMPVKKPIEKVLACIRDEEGLTVSFGDRSWRIPYTYFSVYNKSCDTQNYDVYVDDDGYLILTMNHCEVVYNLGRATDYDGDDGDNTEDIYIEDYRLKQDIRKSNGDLYTHTVAGDVKYPHIKEALISDKQELLFRNDLGEYLITNAKYPNNNGNLGMFPYFNLVKNDITNKRELIGEYYYPDTVYEDRVITIQVEDDIVTNRSMELIGNELRYNTMGTYTSYDVPDVDIYRGVESLVINDNDTLTINTADTQSITSNSPINFNIDSIDFEYGDNRRLYSTITDNDGITRQLEGHLVFDPSKLHGEDGRYVVSTRDNHGYFQIWVGKEQINPDTGDLHVSENPMINMEYPVLGDAKLPQSTTNLIPYQAPLIPMTKTTFNYGINDSLLMTQKKSSSTPNHLKNWVNLGYTSAFNGMDGRHFIDRNKVISPDGTLSIQLIDNSMNTTTLNDMATSSFVTGVSYDSHNKKITVEHTKGNYFYRNDLEGKDANYIVEFETQDDYFFVRWNHKSLPQLIGEISGFEGKEHHYPVGASMDSYVLTFSTSQKDFVLSFDDIKPNTKTIKEIYRVGNTNRIVVKLTDNSVILSETIDDLDGIDGFIPNILGVSEDRFLNITINGVVQETIHVWRADDAPVPDNVLITNDRIEFTEKGNLLKKIEHNEVINAPDGNLPTETSYSNDVYNFVGTRNSYTVPMDIDANDGKMLTQLTYNNGKVEYTIGGIQEFITVSPSDKPLDGKDALYISSVDTDGTYFNFIMSDGTPKYISEDIHGKETNKSIVDVNFDNNRLSFVHKNNDIVTYNDYLDTRHISTSKVGDDLSIDFSHYNFTTTDVDGESYPDGKWITLVDTTKGQFYVEYNNSPSENLAPIDTFDFDTIEILEDGHLKISNPDGTNYTSPTPITVPDATRVLNYTDLVDYNLTLYFDTNEVWSLGNIRGDKSDLDWNSSSVSGNLINGIINNVTIFDSTEYDGNFGFEAMIVDKPYRKHDGVVYNNDVFILKDDTEYLNSLPSKEDSTWSRVIMKDDVRSIIFPPRIISPNDKTLDNEILLSASEISTYYENVDRTKRQFQVIYFTGDWNSPLIDVMVNSDDYMLVDNLLNDKYRWRCRDYVKEQEFPSLWSNEGIFTIESISTYTPTLSLDSTYSLTPTINFSDIVGEGDKYHIVFNDGNDVIDYVSDNKNILIPFGTLDNNTEYTVTGVVTNTDGTRSNWSNSLIFNSGNNPDISTIVPLITIKDANSYVPEVYSINNSSYFFKILEDTSSTAEWSIENITDSSTYSYESLIDLEKLHHRYDSIDNNKSYKIKLRYMINGSYTIWSNEVDSTPKQLNYKPTLDITKDEKPLIYNVSLSYTGEEFPHFSTTWEFENNTTGELLTTFLNNRQYKTLFNRQLPKEWINETIRVRAKMVDNMGSSGSWSDWGIFTVDSFNNIIIEPKIVDYFVHDFGLTIVDGTITKPEQLQYEVTDMDDNIYKQYDVLYNDTLGRLERNIKVPHTEFSKSTLYKMKARQYHSSLGWSEWSNEEIFGYDYRDVAGDYMLNLPVDLPYMSIVAVGAGGGGCKWVTTNHTGGGGSLNFITNVPIKDDFLKITVGEGGISHTDGTDTIISSYIKAGAGAWSTTGGDSGDAEQLLKGACDIVAGLYSGGKGGVYGGGGAAGYASNGAEGGTISGSGESGSGGGGTSRTTSGIGGGISLLGSSPRVMNVGDDGGVFYTGTPIAGGGGKLHETDHKGMDGGVGILYGILRYPLGFTAPWNEDNQ